MTSSATGRAWTVDVGSHEIQGIGAGFVPGVLRTELLDDVVTVERADARTRTREIATNEDILAGISAGAALDAGRLLGHALLARLGGILVRGGEDAAAVNSRLTSLEETFRETGEIPDETGPEPDGNGGDGGLSF